MHASTSKTCRARGALAKMSEGRKAFRRPRGDLLCVRATEEEPFVPYRRPSWVQVPEGFVEPEQHLSYEDEMELFGDEYAPQEVPYGPPSILLVGFQAHEWPQVRMYVDRVGGHDVKVVPVAQETLHERAQDVLRMPEPDWSRPPSDGGPKGAPAGAKRVAVFAGLVQEDIATITELLEGSGLPRIVVTVVLEEEKSSPLGQVVAEAMVKERKSAPDLSVCKELYRDMPKALTAEEQEEIEAVEGIEARQGAAVDPKEEIRKGWKQATSSWSKYPKKGSKTEEMVNAFFEGDMERGNRLLMEMETRELEDGSQSSEQDREGGNEDVQGKVEVVEFEDLGFRMAQEERQAAEAAATAASEHHSAKKVDASVEDDWEMTAASSQAPKGRTLSKAELLEICQRNGLDYKQELLKATKRGIHLT